MADADNNVIGAGEQVKETTKKIEVPGQYDKELSLATTGIEARINISDVFRYVCDLLLCIVALFTMVLLATLTLSWICLWHCLAQVLVATTLMLRTTMNDSAFKVVNVNKKHDSHLQTSTTNNPMHNVSQSARPLASEILHDLNNNVATKRREPSANNKNFVNQKLENIDIDPSEVPQDPVLRAFLNANKHLSRAIEGNVVPYVSNEEDERGVTDGRPDEYANTNRQFALVNKQPSRPSDPKAMLAKPSMRATIKAQAQDDLIESLRTTKTPLAWQNSAALQSFGHGLGENGPRGGRGRSRGSLRGSLRGSGGGAVRAGTSPRHGTAVHEQTPPPRASTMSVSSGKGKQKAIDDSQIKATISPGVAEHRPLDTSLWQSPLAAKSQDNTNQPWKETKPQQNTPPADGYIPPHLRTSSSKQLFDANDLMSGSLDDSFAYPVLAAMNSKLGDEIEGLVAEP